MLTCCQNYLKFKGAALRIFRQESTETLKGGMWREGQPPQNGQWLRGKLIKTEHGNGLD